MADAMDGLAEPARACGGFATEERGERVCRGGRARRTVGPVLLVVVVVVWATVVVPRARSVPPLRAASTRTGGAVPQLGRRLSQ